MDDSTYYNAWLNAILTSTPRDPLEVSLSPVIRLKTKRFKETINGLLQDPWVKVDSRGYQRMKNKSWLIWFIFNKGL
jgi:hypothetical protein